MPVNQSKATDHDNKRNKVSMLPESPREPWRKKRKAAEQRSVHKNSNSHLEKRAVGRGKAPPGESMSGSVGRPLLLLLQVLSVPSLPRDFSVHKLLPYSISGRRHVARGKVPVDGTSMSMVMIVPLQLFEFLLFVAPQYLGKSLHYC